MKVTFEQAQPKFNEVIEFLKKELGAIRAGRANPHLLDTVRAEMYGQLMPLNQLANVNAVDATLLTVKPWDKAALEPILKGITHANLGLNPVIDGDQIRIPIPTLTEERRKEYVKMMKGKLEEARISVRVIRKDVILSLKEDQDNNLLTEDDFKDREKSLQQIVDKINDEIESLGAEKEKELMTV